MLGQDKYFNNLTKINIHRCVLVFDVVVPILKRHGFCMRTHTAVRELTGPLELIS